MFFFFKERREQKSVQQPLTFSRDSYVINVAGVEYDTVEGAFKPVKWDGPLERQMMGIRPKVIFTITNSLSQRKLMSVPRNFYITSPFYKDHPGAATYSKHCDCYISADAGQPTLVNDKNEYTSAVGRTVVNDTYTGFYLGPKETLRFKVFFFSPPFHIDVPGTFSFCGYVSTDPVTGKYREAIFDIDIPSHKLIRTHYRSVQ